MVLIIGRHVFPAGLYTICQLSSFTHGWSSIWTNDEAALHYEASISTSRGARWLVFGVHMIDLHGELRNEQITPVVRAPKLESSWDWELPSLCRWTQAVVPTTPPKSEWASFLKVLVGPFVWNVLLQNRKRRTYICDLSAIQYRRCSRRHLLNWMDFLDRLDVKITQQPEKTRTHQQMLSGTNRSICFPGLVLASCCMLPPRLILNRKAQLNHCELQKAS